MLLCRQISKMDLLSAIILISTFSFSESTERVECRWSGQYICGDKCVELDRQCFCGAETLTYTETAYTCCHDEDTCFYDEFNNVYCNGTKNPLYDLCNNECRQRILFGLTLLPCKHEDECFIGVGGCRGVAKCDL